MTAFQFRMPAGIPGEVNRVGAGCTIEPQVITPLGTTGAPPAYGMAGVLDATSGQFRILASGDTSVYGVLVRPFPTVSSQDGLGVSTPQTSGPCDVMRRGYMTVLLSGSTAAIKGGAVYAWTAAASGAHILGGWEAANPGGSGFAVAGAFFMGPADSSGFVEISFNI